MPALLLIFALLACVTVTGAHSEESGDTLEEIAQSDDSTAEPDYIALFSDYSGLPIISIEFQGSKDVEEDTLCEALTFGEGDPFHAEEIAKSRLELLDLDKFTSASVEVSEQEDGLIVSFVLREKWHVMGVPLLPKKKRNDAACKAKLSNLSLSELEGMPIESIRFSGNKTTRERVLREELLMQEGDVFTVAKMIQSRQSIKNLGLFKSVWVRAEQGQHGVVVTFAVSEKWYILPLPTLSRNTDGDISYGGELTWENVFGLNHRLNLEIEQEDQADGETEQSASVDYRIPKFIGTPYGMRFGIERKRTLQDATIEDLPDDVMEDLPDDIIDEEEPPPGGKVYEYQDRLSVSASRWLKRIAPSQGWIGGIGVRWEREYFDVVEGDPILEEESRTLNFGVNGGFTAIDDFEFYRAGQEYGGDIGTGHHALGSSDTYTNLVLYWRRYQPLQIPVRANLNTQLQFGYNYGLDDQFSLGGADSLRGVLDGDAREGDIFALLNLNWLIPLNRYPAFRWNIFTDVGNAWERDEINPFYLVNTFGVGARWKLRFLVNSTLRLDIAFNPSTRGFKIYAGTSNMF